MKIIRKIIAKINGVPFRERMWYNYMAMIPKDERESKDKRYIVIFDKGGEYISRNPIKSLRNENPTLAIESEVVRNEIILSINWNQS